MRVYENELILWLRENAFIAKMGLRENAFIAKMGIVKMRYYYRLPL